MSKDFNTENYITLEVTEDLEGEILQDGKLARCATLFTQFVTVWNLKQD